MSNPNPSPATRFKPGHSGNPAGNHAARERITILANIRAEFPAMSEAQAIGYEQIKALLRVAARTGDPLARIRAHNSVSRLLRQMRAVGRPRRSMRAGGELQI